MIRGCLEWQKVGLGDVPAVMQATKGFRDEMDLVMQFVHEECFLDKTHEATSGELHRAFSQWCQDRGEEPVSQKMFGLRLGEIPGLSSGKLTGGSRGWRGIRLPNADELNDAA